MKRSRACQHILLWNLSGKMSRYWGLCSGETTIDPLNVTTTASEGGRGELQRFSLPGSFLSFLPIANLVGAQVFGGLQRLKQNKVKHFQMCPRINLTSYYLLIWYRSPTVWGQLTSGVTGFCLEGHNLAEPLAEMVCDYRACLKVNIGLLSSWYKPV